MPGSPRVFGAQGGAGPEGTPQAWFSPLPTLTWGGTAQKSSISCGGCSETQIAGVSDGTPSSLAMHGTLPPLHICPVSFHFINFDDKGKKLIVKGKAQAASFPRRGNSINRDLSILRSDYSLRHFRQKIQLYVQTLYFKVFF